MGLYRRMDPPFRDFQRSDLGDDFSGQLKLVSRLWFACGYRPGIAAYLNFFLLEAFIVKHDSAAPPRFATFRSMADSFYRTDLFIRDVTDSGAQPTGGISSETVRQTLKEIMARHRAIAIPGWMMTHFGFSLLENVEKQLGSLGTEELRLHLEYMANAFRIMGVTFSKDRDLMQRFSRAVEQAHAATSPNLEKHLRNILVLGEMVGVRSDLATIRGMLSGPTRTLFEPIYPRVRPGVLKRLGARLLGKLLMKRAVGEPREAVPVGNRL